jgi:hypothetical protein
MADVRLIDANALEKILYQRYKEMEAKNGPYDHYVSGFDDAITYVEDAPTIDAVPVVHARWVDNHCTACGMMPMGDEMWEHLDETPPRMEFFMSYCPCCGAKMDGCAEA